MNARRAALVWAVAGCVGAFGPVTVMATPPVVPRGPTWENHIDASMINEIVPRGDVLYMATFGGLLLYDTGTGEFEQYDNVAGLPTNTLRCLVFDANGDIYIGTNDVGVAKVRVANGHLTLLRLLSEQIDGIAGSRVNAIANWGSDLVYGSSPGAGIIRNDFAAVRYYRRDGLPADNVLDVLPFGNTVWMATDGGIAVLDRLGFIRAVAGAPAEANALGTDGTTVWVGTDAGVRRYDPADGSWTDVGPHPGSGAEFPMNSFWWDGASMWSGSTRNLFHYSGSGQAWARIQVDTLTARYNTGGGGDALPMHGLAMVSNGDVYMGADHASELRGVNLLRYDGARVTNLFPNGPAANGVVRMAVDLDGSLWCSFFPFYVGKLTPSGAWVNYNTTLVGVQLPSNQFFNLTCLVDADGHKWFCTLSTERFPVPLDELDDRQDANYANDVWTRRTVGSGGGDGLGSLRLQRAALDPSGNRWFLSDTSTEAPNWSGIQILSRDKTAWLQKTPGTDPRMRAGNIVSVAFSDDYAYVATLQAGVQRWYHQGYAWSSLTNGADDFWTTPITTDDFPTPMPSVRAIVLRSDGVLFIGTDGGLFVYDPLHLPPLPRRQLREIPVYAGIGPGILDARVFDLLLDHDENLWVATAMGLNRVARDDENDIQTFTTTAGYLSLSGLRYPLSVISPLASADCRSLALHPAKNVIYIGTLGGLSIYDATPVPATGGDFSAVYVYPNPVYTSRGHTSLKIGNLPGPVTIEVYNLEGQLVHTQSAETQEQEIWDLTDRNGNPVGSGNYIVRIAGSGGSVNRPVAVLR